MQDRSASAALASAPKQAKLRWPALTIALVVLGYALLRLVMNREYEGATWEQLYTLQAPLPFGHRVLVPLLCRPLVEWLGFSIRLAFQFYEILSGIGLFLALRWAIGFYLPDRAAGFFSTLFFFILPLLFLLNYRWPVYYPYDTPSVLFTALAFGLLLRRKWGLATALTAVAALNREIAVFFPLLAFCLHVGRVPIKSLAGWMLAMGVAYLAARGVLSAALPLNPGNALQFHVGNTPRILNNLQWLVSAPLNIAILLAGLGFLPLFWSALRDWLRPDLRHVGLLAAFILLLLAFVGNLYEPRIFGELSVLLYIPLCIACWDWLSDQRP